MRILVKSIKAFLLIIVLAVLISFALPRVVSVERSTVIGAKPSDIFPHVNALRASEAWSPWLGRDPEVMLIYEGPEAGVGNGLVWSSDHPQVGKGRQVITASDPDARVEMALDFGAQGSAEAYFTLDAVDGGTEVVWGFSTDTGYNPIARWMGMMMDGWVGADYEMGLSNLKRLVEGRS